MKEGENPDGVYTADGTQTSCVNIQYYNDPDDPSDDDDYYSQDPCETEATKQAALAEAAKTCEITNNCKVIPGQEEYGGCILDHGPGSPGFFNTDKEERMYCIIGTDHSSDPNHPFMEDESLSGLKLGMDASACKDTKEIKDGDITEKISYDICDAMLAKNAAKNMADLKAAAADAAAARAALKAGLTCLVENCETQANGDICYLQDGTEDVYVCDLKSGENPDGVTTTDGSQTACALTLSSKSVINMYPPTLVIFFKAKQEALKAAAAAEAEAQKSYDITQNCKPVPEMTMVVVS